MEKVTGIGGLFFKAKDPLALSAWYAQHLGVNTPPASYEDSVWEQEAGPTVFAPMDMDSPDFPKDTQLYINFRVNDLQAMCRQLEAAGIPVQIDPETYPNGYFAALQDPEGNLIQLWQFVRPESSPSR
jgi:predicted enzyme related to lactoylglutathione lyase